MRHLPLVVGLLVLLALSLGWGLVQKERREVVSGMSGATGGAVSEPQWSNDSATGYLDGARRLIVPGRHPETFLVARQLAASGAFRQRTVEFDNPPDGRSTRMTAPTRGVLRLVASVGGGQQPAGVALETAVLNFSPAVQGAVALVLLLLGWRRFGWVGGVVASVCWLGLFPLVGSFQPGVVESRLLVAALGAAAALVVLGALRSSRSWDWILAGVFAGLAVWVRADLALPMTVALLAGGAAGLWRAGALAPLRLMTRACAVVVLVAWAVEFLPTQVDLRLEAVHVVHAFLLLGLGEAVAASREKMGTAKKGAFVFGGVAVGVWLAALLLGPTEGFFSLDPMAGRMPGAPEVQADDGFDTLAAGGLAAAASGAAYLLVVLLSVRCLVDPESRSAVRVASAVAAVLLLAWGFWQPHTLPLALAVAIGLVVAFLAGDCVETATEITGTEAPRFPSRPWELAGWAGCLLAVGFGLWAARPARGEDGKPLASETDAATVVLRDVAHWLRARNLADEPVLVAPPDSVAALGYLSDWKTVGSYHWENPEGTQGALRIASASSPDEALELLSRRGVTHLVLPSWDTSLDVLLASAYRSSAIPPQSFLAALRRWEPPRWLQPLAYPPPRLPGIEGLDVVVFKVVEEQDEVSARARLAEFLADTQRLDLASAVAGSLGEFQSDPNALVARAYVAMAANAPAAFREAFVPLPALMDAGGTDALSFDRRVSLLVVLAQAQEYDRAKALLENLMQELSVSNMRELSPNQLLRLVVLSRRAGVPFADRTLEEAALELLPRGVRNMR
ncbi:MAG: hypothetical protein SFV32_09205 [Opitutaceae bacterium]|nr:hypothetical protein [Opitutaceae bacterium]